MIVPEGTLLPVLIIVLVGMFTTIIALFFAVNFDYAKGATMSLFTLFIMVIGIILFTAFYFNYELKIEEFTTGMTKIDTNVIYTPEGNYITIDEDEGEGFYIDKTGDIYLIKCENASPFHHRFSKTKVTSQEDDEKSCNDSTQISSNKANMAGD